MFSAMVSKTLANKELEEAKQEMFKKMKEEASAATSSNTWASKIFG